MGWFGRLFGDRNDAPAERSDPKQAFAKLVAREAAEHPFVAQVSPHPEQRFALLLQDQTGQQSWTLQLDNLYLETRELPPEQRLASVRRFLRGLADPSAEVDWEEAEPRLVPLIRLVSFVTSAPPGVLTRPFLPFLPELVGIDREDTIQITAESHLLDWRQDADTVFARAVENLLAHVAEEQLESYDPTAGYPIWHVTRNDSYESSRLALPGWLASFQDHVEGNPIAVVPHRSALIVSGDARPEAVARLARVAEAEFAASPRALSPVVYGLAADGGIEPLSVPPDHPQRDQLDRGPRILAVTCYADQKDQLDAAFEREGMDIFVPKLACMEDPATRRLTTWTTLAQDVDALLPQADCLGLVWDQAGETQHMLVPWDAVTSEAPTCLELEPELDPPRFRVRNWPSDAAMEKLTELALGDLE